MLTESSIGYFTFVQDINFFAMLIIMSFMSMNLGLSSQAFKTEKKKEFDPQSDKIKFKMLNVAFYY